MTTSPNTVTMKAVIWTTRRVWVEILDPQVLQGQIHRGCPADYSEFAMQPLRG
jgi:hypothetical protein